MDYFVLKGRDLREPISERDLATEIHCGALTGDDLVRPVDGFLWSPVRKLLPANGAAGEPTVERPVAAGLSPIDSLDKPVRMGALCLGFGVLVLLLSPWPLLLYGPLLAAAFAAGVIAMFRKRLGAGLSLCAGAILIPFLFNWFSAIVGPAEPPGKRAAPPSTALAEPAPESAGGPPSASGASTPPPIIVATPIDEAARDDPKVEAAPPAASPGPRLRNGVAMPRPVSPSASLPDAGRTGS